MLIGTIRNTLNYNLLNSSHNQDKMITYLVYSFAYSLSTYIFKFGVTLFFSNSYLKQLGSADVPFQQYIAGVSSPLLLLARVYLPKEHTRIGSSYKISELLFFNSSFFLRDYVGGEISDIISRLS